MILAQALSLDSMNGVVRMVRNVVLGTLRSSFAARRC